MATEPKVNVAKKMEENHFIVEPMTNKYNGERQIQINDTYADKETGEFKYARRGVNINLIDLPAVVKILAEMYYAETGKTLEV